MHGGPGSGKTTISIIKADLLVTQKLRPGQKVLFLSFARATVTRVVEALAEHSKAKPEVRRNVAVDTYHAFFWRILKTQGYLLGLPRRLDILPPAARAVALSHIRHKFGSSRKLTPTDAEEKEKLETEELNRLAFKEGKVCFDLFADITGALLAGSAKIRGLLSTAYPVVILDEFQDTNAGQWLVVQQFGIGSTLIALADAEQRIYDFIGADPERLNHFRQRFTHKEVDLGGENHRSVGTDIALFGNHLLTGKFQKAYKGLQVFTFEANENQAQAELRGQTLQARQRLIKAKGAAAPWSLAVLVPTKKLMRWVSDSFRAPLGTMPTINHRAAIDMEGAILAAEIIAFLLQPHSSPEDFGWFVDLLCNFFRGKGGDDPAISDIEESLRIRKAFDRSAANKLKGKAPPANSIIIPSTGGYEQCLAYVRTGNPDEDWLAIRDILASCGCKRLARVAEEARNVRLLERGTQLREALALDWRDNGCYANALAIVRDAFVREHFATATRTESGVIVMNMHKAKGKQFDEVIIFEGWPRTHRGTIVANFDRIVRENTRTGDLTHARQNFRVSVTRAKLRTTILTPKIDPCVLLLPG